MAAKDFFTNVKLDQPVKLFLRDFICHAKCYCHILAAHRLKHLTFSFYFCPVLKTQYIGATRQCNKCSTVGVTAIMVGNAMSNQSMLCYVV